MNTFLQMFNLQIILLLYIICGVICRKLNIITKINQGQFINFVLNILMPCMVFNSFKNVTLQIMKSAGLVLVISLCVCVFSNLLGNVIYKTYEDEKRNVLRYATLVNNAGFAGLPLAQQLYGDQGLLYASIFLIPIRIFMWSAGITILSNQKTDIKDLMIKLVKNPNIVAVVVGIIRGLMQMQLPGFLDQAIGNLSACVSPMSMIVIGAIIADVKIKGLFEKGAVPYTFVRLIGIPWIVLLITKLFGFDVTVVGISTMLSAMPAATSTTLLASQYKGNVTFASKLVFVSTILSIFTAPFIMLFI